MALTLDTLAQAPRWSDERTLALVGLTRGDTLGAWGTNLTKRFGHDAVDKIRRRAPAVADIAPDLDGRVRVPVYAQLLLTEAIVDEFLAGDLLALYPLLVADTRAGLGRVRLALLRTMGASAAFRLGPRNFRAVHEHGKHEVFIDGRSARLEFRANPLFAHPTWRVLQVMATRVLLELVDANGTVVGLEGDDAFTANVTW